MNCIVHLDLKGAPPKVSYLEKVLTLIVEWGATGVLIEWEDTFPFTGELECLGTLSNASGDEMYSMEEVLHLLKIMKDLGLEPVQLIQTIGHMEYVLKHKEFHHLREQPVSPNVLCPSRPDAKDLLFKMVDQLLAVQPDAKYLHIGADEAFVMSQCQHCLQVSEHKDTDNRRAINLLYIKHIEEVALYVKKKRPEIILLMWDDMMRAMLNNTCYLNDLKESKIPNLVIPVIWEYNRIESFSLTDTSCHNLFGQLFPKVWAASAFKGADGSCQMRASSERYVSNQEAWLVEVRRRKLNYEAIILTGWSRFDHYATLCELLPEALPSLASCLKHLMHREEPGETQHTEGNPISSVHIVDELPEPQWPARSLALNVRRLAVLTRSCAAFIEWEIIKTYMNAWQVERRFVNKAVVINIYYKAKELLIELYNLRGNLSEGLRDVTGKRSCEEWIGTNVDPVMAKINNIYATAAIVCEVQEEVIHEAR